jgi:putative transposase
MKTRKQMVECMNEAIDLKTRCELLGVARRSMYYKPKVKDKSDTLLTNHLRMIYLEKPFFGYRKMTIALKKLGFDVNHKRVQRLLQSAGIRAIYPSKRTTIRNSQHKIFPYLLKDLVIDRPNQVWQVDITYIKIKNGFVYLVCLIDVFSRKIMGYSLSTFLDTASCLHAFNEAIKHGIPEIVNSDQGCQFTSEIWINAMQHHNIRVSMDGKGRWADNIFVERLWRSVKYELVFLHSFETVEQVKEAVDQYFLFYNQDRFHQSLNYHTPNMVFELKKVPTKKELFESFVSQLSQQQGAAMF